MRIRARRWPQTRTFVPGHASNIASNLGEGTAEELVEYALSDEGRESWGIELPEWFSDYDRRLLIEWVEEELH